MLNSTLDDPGVYKRIDPEGMRERLHEMPWQCQQSWRMAMDFNLPPEYSRVDKVVILGMGGSAIGGDLVSSLALNEARLPVFVSRNYGLPAFVDNRTLVITSSYSGNTEETLTSFEKALRTEARKIAITTGGRLKNMAERANIPVFTFNYKAQPRAALGFSLFPILCFLQKLGFLGDKSAEIALTIKALEEVSRKNNEDVPLADNPAKQLASTLCGSLPVIYGGGLVAEVAHRWKTQFNENSKSWAFYEVFSELNHNAVAGYEFPKALSRKIKVILLRSALLEPRILQRYQITCQLLDRAGISYEFVDAQGDTPLSQMMSLVLFGDYVSYYLAILYEVDPTKIKAIDYLKEQLSRK